MRSTKRNEENNSFSSKEELKEWVKCRNSFHYFINKYCYIYGAAGVGKFKFRTYKFQDYVIYNIQKFKLNIVKKPRQMGLTWLAGLYALWLTTFYGYKNVVIISIKEASAIRFLHRIKFVYRHLPAFLKAKITNGKKNELGTKTEIEFDNSSRIWSVPSSPEAGRSEAVSLMIIDEAAFVAHMEEIWAAAYPTLSTGGAMLMLSTTNGVGNRYHKVYTDAISGKNNFNPIDLRWYHHPERDHKWYEQQRIDLGPKLTAQEVDCDFLSSGNNVFNLSTLRSMEETVRSGRYKTLELTHFISYCKRIEKIGLERHKINSEIPAPKIIQLENFVSGEIQQYELPKKNHRYVIGVDTAKNKANKDDNSALVVMDYETMETVMTFRGKMGPEALPEFVTRVGYYYNEAFLCIENTGIGLATVMGVFNLGYLKDRIYADQDFKVRKDKRNDYDKNELELGFSTNTRSKPIMITDLNNALEDGSLQLKNMSAILEFTVYETDSNGGMGAARGYTDDLVMAYALAVQGRKMYPRHEFSEVIVGSV